MPILSYILGFVVLAAVIWSSFYFTLESFSWLSAKVRCAWQWNLLLSSYFLVILITLLFLLRSYALDFGYHINQFLY